MKKIRVRIGMKCYESMRDAARDYGCSYISMVKRFKEEGQIRNNILTLNSFELKHKKSEKIKHPGKVRCPVRCITTGKEYPSILSAAKAIGVHMWTMSLKMEKAGKFIDNNGNEYIRLNPMQTTRNYPNTTANIIRKVTFRERKNSNVQVSTEKNTALEQALEIIKGEAIAKIKAGSYQEATKYIDALTLMK